jgi:hypothetical protein
VEVQDFTVAVLEVEDSQEGVEGSQEEEAATEEAATEEAAGKR